MNNMTRTPLFHRTKQVAAPVDLNMFASVLQKQTELLERMLNSSGTNMAGGEQRQITKHRQPDYTRLYNTKRGHQTLPLQYDHRQLGTHFGNSRLKAIHRQKHDTILADLATIPGGHRPLYELGFFQDCALDTQVWSLMVQPQDSIINLIPVVADNSLHHKYAFVTSYNVEDQAAQTEPTAPCEPCLVIQSNFDACKIEFPMGRLCRRAETLETNELIRRFCNRHYDDFFFIGDLRGPDDFPSHFGLGAQIDRNFIIQSAVRRQLFNLGRYFQLWMMKIIWSGDPANNSAGNVYSEPYGLVNLIRNDYGEVTNDIPVESVGGVNLNNCAALNSDIKDFGGQCINDPTAPAIWQYLQEMEDTLYRRAQALRLLPVQMGIFMISPIWNELTKILPCQMASDGCVNIGTNPATIGLNVNDGGSGMFNLAAREQMLRSMTLTINGRTYPVYIDDSMPYTLEPADPPTTPTPMYCSDIWFIPFTAAGEPVLFLKHIDYSELDQALAPIPGSMTDSLGWSDDGRFHHVISQTRYCFDIQSKMEPSLVFLAPQLAGRIQNVCACPMQTKPFAFDGAGVYAPTLGA